jgi:hypothetical protein
MINSYTHSISNAGLRLWKRALKRVALGRVKARHAFSLVEIMVTVLLLSVIILGLVAMFNQVRRAFTSSITQVDLLEGGRAAMDLISSQLAQASPSSAFNTENFHVDIPPLPIVPMELPLADPTDKKTNVLEEFVFLAAYNQQWTGIGFRVGTPDLGVGTLYTTNLPLTQLKMPLSDAVRVITNTPLINLHRILDGVVHFRVLAYSTNGVIVSGSRKNVNAQYDVINQAYNYQFYSNAIPAFVEVELGVLESRTLERFRALGGNPTLSRNFLASHAAQIHMFRRRIPIRNVDPDAY